MPASGVFIRTSRGEAARIGQSPHEWRPGDLVMRRLRVLRKADTLDALDLRIEAFDALPRGPDEVLVAVRAAGVNRSDVSAALGRMPQAVWPRTPGRDWAGVVMEGPDGLVGQEVFGAGGDLGITRDGTHASHLVEI